MCGPASPVDRMGEAAGSTATILASTPSFLNARPTPVMVPPVPMPETNTSTLPSVSRMISGPVVDSWIAALASLANWRTRTAPLSASDSAFSTAPRMPSALGVSSSVAPNARSSARRSFDMDSGIVRTTL